MLFTRSDAPYTHNEEPSLDEILADPIVRLLMARDGVEPASLRNLFMSTAGRRQACA